MTPALPSWPDTPVAVDAPLDLTDRVARQLGRVALLDQGSGNLLAIDAAGAVDLRDRQARVLGRIVEQGGIADSLQAAGQAAAPIAGTAIVTLAAPPAGVYALQIVTAVTGDAAQLANLQLQRAGVSLGGLLSAATPTSVTRERVTLNGAQALSVVNPAAGAAGSVYAAFIAATQLA